MSLIKRLTVAQAFRIAEDEVSGCLTRKPPQPTVSAQSSLVRADACEGAVEALQAIAADPQIGGTGHPADVHARNALEALGLAP
jgi:hypothetical protein